MLRRNWKPFLLGLGLGTVIGFVARVSLFTLGTRNAWQGQIAIVSAGLVFVALLVQTFRKKWNWFLLGGVLGTVITLWLLLFSLAF